MKKSKADPKKKKKPKKVARSPSIHVNSRKSAFGWIKKIAALSLFADPTLVYGACDTCETGFASICNPAPSTMDMGIRCGE
jgi:hypothetical protein